MPLFKFGCLTVDIDDLLLRSLQPHGVAPGVMRLFLCPDTAASPDALRWSVSHKAVGIPQSGPFLTADDVNAPLAIYRVESGWLWMRSPGRDGQRYSIHVSPDHAAVEACLPITYAMPWQSFLFQDLSKIFAYSVLSRGGIVLHAVVMEWRGMGILLSAPSGTGKTTQARLWQQHEGAHIINGDRALCGLEDSIWMAYGQPWCGSSGECENRKIPICAIVLLSRGIRNHVEKLSQVNAAIGLISTAYAPVWDAASAAEAVDRLGSLTEKISVFRLHCLPDIDAVSTLKNELEKLCI